VTLFSGHGVGLLRRFVAINLAINVSRMTSDDDN